MKNLVLRVGIIVLKIIYSVVKVLPVSDKVTFISRQSNDVPLDFRMLIDEISRTYPQIKTIVLAKKLTMSMSGLLCYIFYTLRHIYHLATSKVVVVDGYCIPVSLLKHKKNVKIIQIWHALGAVKKFGYQTLDKPSGSSRQLAEMMKMHRNYDYVLAISDATAKHFCEAFDVSESKIIKSGLPRVDYLLNVSSNSNEKIEEYYKFDHNKECVLYAPTFRKGKKIPLEELVDKIDFDRFNLIVKLHPLDALTANKSSVSGVVFDDKFSTYDLAKYCDRIITDYSALGIEISLLDKPLYYFIYDVDDYSDDPGMNIDLEAEMGKYAVRTADGLAEVLKEEYDSTLLDAFRDKYVGEQTGSCTADLSEFIVSLISSQKGEK